MFISIFVKKPFLMWLLIGWRLAAKKSEVTFKYSCRPHDDVIKWKHFPRYWPFVRGIHRSPVNFPHKGQWRGASMFSLICALNKRLSKQSWGWWFETLSRPLWCHCNEHGFRIEYSRGKQWENTTKILFPLKMYGMFHVFMAHIGRFHASINSWSHNLKSNQPSKR